MLQVMGKNIPPAVLLFDANFPNKPAEVQCFFFKKIFFLVCVNQLPNILYIIHVPVIVFPKDFAVKVQRVADHGSVWNN